MMKPALHATQQTKPGEGRTRGELLARRSGRPAGNPENPAAKRDISRRNGLIEEASWVCQSRRRLCILPLEPRIQIRAVPCRQSLDERTFLPDLAQCPLSTRPWGVVGHGQTDSALHGGRHACFAFCHHPACVEEMGKWTWPATLGPSVACGSDRRVFGPTMPPLAGLVSASDDGWLSVPGMTRMREFPVVPCSSLQGTADWRHF